jgi:hypothetical protein
MSAHEHPPHEHPHHDDRQVGAPPPEDEQPLGADAQGFVRGREGTLAEQADLIDEQGTDIRNYTGEPVETDDGIVIPQQMNVGSDNMAGGGEWPTGERPET